MAACRSVQLTHALALRRFGPWRRWRGKAFLPDGSGSNRFGGNRRNRFGLTSSDAREMQARAREETRRRKALYDPLMRSMDPLLAEPPPTDEMEMGAAASAAAPEEVREEGRCRNFEARIEASHLDGQPALVLDYDAQGDGKHDALWGRALGMRDELREVAPGVLVGLGSLRVTGGMPNCSPFVLVRAPPDDPE